MTDPYAVPQLIGADYLLDQLADHSACPACGSPMPVRLGDGGCSDCRDYPRCGVCGAWTGLGHEEEDHDHRNR